MDRYIIAYGWRSDVDIVEAKDIDDARCKATERSMLAGLLDDDLVDTTWAAPYSDDLAHEMGLLEYHEPRSMGEAYDRANRPPWR